MTIRIGLFRTLQAWPLWVAVNKGFLPAESVSLHYAANSPTQMQGLIDGSFDVVFTAFDNVLAFAEADSENAERTRIAAFLGGDDGLLSLVGRAGVEDIEDIRGQTVAVDARDAGYSLVLYELLARRGLDRDVDYQIEVTGGVVRRLDDLVEARHAATMLIAPLDIAAERRGLNVLQRAADFIGPYQGNVAASTRAFMDAGAALDKLARSYLEAGQWLRDPTNREEALRIAAEALGGVAPSEDWYHRLIGPQGLILDGAIDLAAAAGALTLRQQWVGGRFREPEQYIERFWEQG